PGVPAGPGITPPLPLDGGPLPRLALPNRPQSGHRSAPPPDAPPGRSSGRGVRRRAPAGRSGRLADGEGGPGGPAGRRRRPDRVAAPGDPAQVRRRDDQRRGGHRPRPHRRGGEGPAARRAAVAAAPADAEPGLVTPLNGHAGDLPPDDPASPGPEALA